MADRIRALAIPSPRPSMRSFQVLSERDLPRLRTFLLGLAADPWRRSAGAGISDRSIASLCCSVDWSATTIIARTHGGEIDAIAIIAAPAGARTAELSIAGAGACDCASAVAGLLDLALTVAALSYSELVVHRAHAMPELVALLDRSAPAASGDLIRICVPSCSAGNVAC